MEISVSVLLLEAEGAGLSDRLKHHGKRQLTKAIRKTNKKLFQTTPILCKHVIDTCLRFSLKSITRLTVTK
jgi:hypothetical protein